MCAGRDAFLQDNLLKSDRSESALQGVSIRCHGFIIYTLQYLSSLKCVRDLRCATRSSGDLPATSLSANTDMKDNETNKLRRASGAMLPHVGLEESVTPVPCEPVEQLREGPSVASDELDRLQREFP